MKFIILIWAAQAVWAETTSFYHGDSQEFQQPPSAPLKSLFGFSTTYDQFNKQLIISAPTEDENGSVYECNIKTKMCTKLTVIIPRYAPQIYKHGYWFGATVKSGSTFLVACAPRFTRNSFGAAEMSGRCYVRNRTDDSFYSIIKTRNQDTPLIAVELTMETLGWSIDIASNDYLIVGGPGMYYKKGLAAILPNSPVNSSQELQRIDHKKITANFNFGYGVAVGYFLNENRLSYAIGSTYGQHGKGDVYFYQYSNDDEINGPRTLKKEVDDNVVGSMFGAVLCAANLQNNAHSKPTDLLVGAPTYASESTYNAGAVYVYVKSEILPRYKRKITSSKSGSFFGNAIVTVGDLNGDDKDEIAIGAPYEDDGRGAVYLYSGADLISDKSEKTLSPLQRFQPSGYQSFGLSLSALKDYDNNGCNELAISAPYVNKVVVYSCMASVTITNIYAKFPILQNRSQNLQEKFSFQVCIDFKYPEKPKYIIGDISTDVAIHHLSAKLANPNNGDLFTFPFSLKDKKPTYCKDLDLVLPKDGNYGVKIGYEITTKLVDDPMKLKSFDSSRVVLSDVSKFSHTDAIWAAECAGECKPNLNMSISPNFKTPFMIGSNETVTMRIDVENTGEVAYNPCIQIKVLNAALYQPPADCSKNEELDDVYECTYRKPLKTNKFWTIDNITVNVKGLTSRHQNFTIRATLFDFCKNNSKTQAMEYAVSLKSHYEGLDIKGTTNIGEVININENDLRDGKQFEQIYTITNNGMTNFENLITEVKIPKEKFMQYAKTPVSCYKEEKYEERSNGRIKSENDVELIAECHMDSLPKNNFFKVAIYMEIIPKSLDYNELRKQSVMQTSSLTLIVDSFNKKHKVTTTIQLRETAVAIWIYILSGVVGILLIIILVIVLHLCGCLRRRKKQILNNLKATVHRESVRRSINAQSVSLKSRSGCEQGSQDVPEGSTETNTGAVQST